MRTRIKIIEASEESPDRILREIAETEIMDSNERKEIEIALYRIRNSKMLNRTLLHGAKPLFATPHTGELVEKLETVAQAASKIKNKYGDKLIGISIFGSTAKGYFEKGIKKVADPSDIDAAMVISPKVTNEEREKIVRRSKDDFRENIKPIELCLNPYSRDPVPKYFHGLFYGDHKELAKLQLEVLQKMKPEAWDELRRTIMHNEMNLHKAAMRYGLSDEETKTIAYKAMLRRVPPPYNEALKILENRVARYKQKKPPE